MSVCRCEVENVRDGRATVFFVDYGNRGVVRLEELRQVPLHLHVDLAAIPALAMEASLAGIQANQARYSLPSQPGQVQSSQPTRPGTVFLANQARFSLLSQPGQVQSS
jgi:hypothetical protein